MKNGGCPDANQLAAYAEGAVDAIERRQIEAHLVTCDDCRAVVAETAAFAMSEDFSARAPVVPVRWRAAIGVALAAAATVVLAVALARGERFFGRSTANADLTALVAAVEKEPTRPVQGRLTVRFKYAPAPAPLRGARDREASPEVQIAAARLEKVAAANGTAENRDSLGVAYLAVHDFDRAIDVLEQSVEKEPRNAAFESDLAAAYLARAAWRQRNDDLPKALAAAERAIAADPHLLEAHFNRALALESLHLDGAAETAWAAYASLDPSGPWASEAATHAAALKNR